jgi:cysteinyl-tRNA synthetase
MPLELFNTESGRRETFRPRHESEVGMYVCGPTVYDYAHVGHARSYVTYDVLRRYLTYRGYRVKLVVNITDVEDSITQRAKDLGMTPAEVAERFTQAFLEDMDALNVLRADRYPRVTDCIPRIIEVTKRMVEEGCAYQVGGDVLFRVSRTPGYGKLSHQSFEDVVVDVQSGGDGRESPLDFVVWRETKEGEPSWESPWGRGRPGWHIECYVMATDSLGPRMDIHGGGLDLVFPHHESEAIIAKACGAGDYVKMWVHNGHVTYEREKMSKSKGNFATIREVLEKVDGEALRYYLLKTHYRETLEFQWSELEAAAKEMGLLRESLANLRSGLTVASSPGDSTLSDGFTIRFEETMDGDLDTPGALRLIKGFVGTLEGKWSDLDDTDRSGALTALNQAAAALGVLQ